MMKKIQAGLFALFVLAAAELVLSPLLLAKAVSGKIEQVRDVSEDQKILVVEAGNGKTDLIVTPQTSVQGWIAAKKIESGSVISLEAEKKSSRKGFHSPFKGLSKSLRKQMGLPNMPDVDLPELPPQAVPKAPSLPEIPQKPGPGGNAEKKPAEVRKSLEPSAEEKNLFGKAGELSSIRPAQNLQARGGEKVIKIETAQEGMKLRLQNLRGELRDVLVKPERRVLKTFSPDDLQQRMNIQADTVEKDKKNLARQITVVE